MGDKERASTLSQSLATYLVAVEELVFRYKLARVRDVALLCGVHPKTAEAALVRLRDLGLVSYPKREYIDVTAEGLSEAGKIRRTVMAAAEGGEWEGDAVVHPVVAVRIVHRGAASCSGTWRPRRAAGRSDSGGAIVEGPGVSGAASCFPKL